MNQQPIPRRWAIRVLRVLGFCAAASVMTACSTSPAATQAMPTITIHATNTLDIARPGETIELDWSAVANKVEGLTPDNAVVRDPLAGDVLLSQAVDLDADGAPDQFLLQADFAPGQRRAFTVSAHDSIREQPASLVFGRHVPERLDDFAWENDRIAFRVYGPALEPANDAGSGIDVWVKSVRYPIIDKWYAGGDYHNDHGEGLDYYKVGKSRGAGGLGVFADGRLYNSGHYTASRVIATGPVRFVFELDYAAWDTPLGEISETKRISIDAGSNLSRIESMFTLDSGAHSLPIGIGLVRRGDGGMSETGEGWAGYWEPAAGQHGHTGIGIMLPHIDFEVIEHTQTDTTGVGSNAHDETNTHDLVVTDALLWAPFVYYAGAGWSKSGDFPDADAWFAYLGTMAKRLANPIEVRLAE